MNAGGSEATGGQRQLLDKKFQQKQCVVLSKVVQGPFRPHRSEATLRAARGGHQVRRKMQRPTALHGDHEGRAHERSAGQDFGVGVHASKLSELKGCTGQERDPFFDSIHVSCVWGS